MVTPSPPSFAAADSYAEPAGGAQRLADRRPERAGALAVDDADERQPGPEGVVQVRSRTAPALPPRVARAGPARRTPADPSGTLMRSPAGARACSIRSIRSTETFIRSEPNCTSTRPSSPTAVSASPSCGNVAHVDAVARFDLRRSRDRRHASPASAASRAPRSCSRSLSSRSQGLLGGARIELAGRGCRPLGRVQLSRRRRASVSSASRWATVEDVRPAPARCGPAVPPGRREALRFSRAPAPRGGAPRRRPPRSAADLARAVVSNSKCSAPAARSRVPARPRPARAAARSRSRSTAPAARSSGGRSGSASRGRTPPRRSAAAGRCARTPSARRGASSR